MTCDADRHLFVQDVLVSMATTIPACSHKRFKTIFLSYRLEPAGKEPKDSSAFKWPFRALQSIGVLKKVSVNLSKWIKHCGCTCCMQSTCSVLCVRPALYSNTPQSIQNMLHFPGENKNLLPIPKKIVVKIPNVPIASIYMCLESHVKGLNNKRVYLDTQTEGSNFPTCLPDNPVLARPTFRLSSSPSHMYSKTWARQTVGAAHRSRRYWKLKWRAARNICRRKMSSSPTQIGSATFLTKFDLENVISALRL